MSSMRQDDPRLARPPAPTPTQPAEPQPGADVGRFARYLAQATARIEPAYIQAPAAPSPHSYSYELYHQLRTVIDASLGIECVDFPYQIHGGASAEPQSDAAGMHVLDRPDLLVGGRGAHQRNLIALVVAPLTTTLDQLARDLALLTAWTSWGRDGRAQLPYARAIYLLYGAAGRSITTIRSWAGRLAQERGPAAADLARVDLYWHRRSGGPASAVAWTPAPPRDAASGSQLRR